MGTVMAWAAFQAGEPGASCQMVSLVRCTASASIPPAGPGASVAVPAGSAGRVRHEVAVLVMVAAWLPFSIIAAVPAGPNDVAVTALPFSRNAGDRVQWLVLSADQAARRLVAGPVPAASRASMLSAVLVSLSTVMGWRARVAGSCGPAACQVPPLAAKTPAVPGWLQPPASRGSPDGVNAAAVRPCSPQCLPAGVTARDRWAAKTPAVPGWLQPPASRGSPDGVNAAAVRPCSPQCLPAGVTARDRWVARVAHLV